MNERGVSHLVALKQQLGLIATFQWETWMGLRPWANTQLSHYDHIDRSLSLDFPATALVPVKIAWLIAQLSRMGNSRGLVSDAVGDMSLGVAKSTYEVGHKRLLRWLEDAPPAKQDIPIDEYDFENGSPDEFQKLYVKNPRPVILRGFDHDLDLAHWSFERMTSEHGETPVLLTTEEDDGIEGTMKDLRNPGVYLHNSEQLFLKFPQMLEELKSERLERWLGKKRGFAQLFVGLAGTGATFHCAHLWNMFHMIEGRKTWYFVHPRDSALIYPALISAGARFGLIPYPEEADLEMYPLFKYCPVYKATLNPGDVLLNPPYWWHAIRNVSATTVGVASRWSETGQIVNRRSEEDYGINSFFSYLDAFSPLYMLTHFQMVSGTMSPRRAGENTILERANRFMDTQAELSGTTRL